MPIFGGPRTFVGFFIINMPCGQFKRCNDIFDDVEVSFSYSFMECIIVKRMQSFKFFRFDCPCGKMKCPITVLQDLEMSMRRCGDKQRWNQWMQFGASEMSTK